MYNQNVVFANHSQSEYKNDNGFVKWSFLG